MGDYRPTILVLCIVFPIVAFISICLRFQARRLVRQKLKADDWLAVAALLSAYAFTAIVLVSSRKGRLGAHMSFNEKGLPIIGPWYPTFIACNYAMIIAWNLCVGITKLSIAFLYKRIFSTAIFHKLTWFTIVLLIAWTTAFTLVGIFPCRKFSDGWATGAKGECIKGPAMYTAGVASNIGLDILILVIPQYQVWKLHMPMRRKIAVAAIFLLGSFVIITGVIRLVLLTRAFNALENSHTVDVTYEYSPPMFWTVVELNLGVVCACLPLMRPVWTAALESPFVTKVFSSLAYSSTSTKKSKASTYHQFDQQDGMEMGLRSDDQSTVTVMGKA